MKRLNTKKQMIEFAQQNVEFLDFLYMEGIWEKRKGLVSVLVDDKLEILGGGFEDSSRKGMKFSVIDKKSEKKDFKKVISGYYIISNEDEILCSIRRTVNCNCSTGKITN